MLPDGGYQVSGQMKLLELDRLIGYDFSRSNAVTLSGLIVETLETIPVTNVCLRMDGYCMEIRRVSKNRVAQVKIFPK